MKIKTSETLMENSEQVSYAVAKFWNKISEGWREIWGPHIHHGYYENDSVTQLEAQEKLIVKLVNLLDLQPHRKILDVGCGMGGSSLYLAKHYQAEVIGVTLSTKQVAIAQQQAKFNGINQVQFRIDNALSLTTCEDNSMDIVWSLESCEQFFDKPLFIQQAFRVLKKQGLLMLATWCSDQEEYTSRLARKYKKLCTAFDLPYMPTMDYYRSILELQGFMVQHCLDWSNQVKKSWDLGVSLASSYSFLKLLKMGGWRGLRFAKQIKLMRDAFHESRVKYGVFVVVKQ